MNKASSEAVHEERAAREGEGGRGRRSRGRGSGRVRSRGRGRGRAADSRTSISEEQGDENIANDRKNRREGRGHGKGHRKHRGTGARGSDFWGRRSTVIEGEEEEEEEDKLCVVCAEKLTHYSVGECNHPNTCATCAMRSRVLLKDRACPECKTVLDRVVVAVLPPSEPARSFESFGLWGDHGGPNAHFDEVSGMVFYACPDMWKTLALLRGLHCPIKGWVERAGTAEAGGDDVEMLEDAFESEVALREHLRAAHRRHYCGLCLEHRPLFLGEQETFTVGALRKHESGVDGHPACGFCDRRCRLAGGPCVGVWSELLFHATVRWACQSAFS
ncbi:unnamed protein product [Discosporangium mesarthrocarpum]